MRGDIDFSETSFGDGVESQANEACLVSEHDEREDIPTKPGSVNRTKALVLAAIRVWELKRGIRD